MLDAVLTKKNASVKVKFTVKSLVAASVVALAVLLPQLCHLVFGAAGGVLLLPMYLPVLVGGCVLGWKWGLGVGILSPVASFLLTFALSDPMPASVRLPYMVVELAVFAAVSGTFSKKISKNSWMAFPAVLLAAVSGRCVFLALAAIFRSVSPLSLSLVWSQVQTGLLGLVLQAVLVPVLVMGLKKLMDRETRE